MKRTTHLNRGVARNCLRRGFWGQKLSKEGVLRVRKRCGFMPECRFVRVLVKMTKKFWPMGGRVLTPISPPLATPLSEVIWCSVGRLWNFGFGFGFFKPSILVLEYTKVCKFGILPLSPHKAVRILLLFCWFQPSEMAAFHLNECLSCCFSPHIYTAKIPWKW